MLRIVLYALPRSWRSTRWSTCVQTDEKDVQGLPKLVWVLLIVLVWIVGPVAWLVAGRKGRGLPGLPPRTTDGPRGRAARPHPRPGRRPGLPARPQPAEDPAAPPRGRRLRD